MNPAVMTRREAIIKMAVIMGGTMVGPRLLHGAWDPNSSVSGGDSDAQELALLDEIGDTIIPATDVPGAKAVHIGAFITMMLRDCYEPADQAAVAGGIREIATTFRAKYGHEFVGAPAAERTEFLNVVDVQQKNYSRNRKADAAPHHFRVLKELTVLGYFSSEIGATQALRFMEVPGKFDGTVPYKKGDRAWFS
jgi:hypothetical protein